MRIVCVEVETTRVYEINYRENVEELGGQGQKHRDILMLQG